MTPVASGGIVVGIALMLSAATAVVSQTVRVPVRVYLSAAARFADFEVLLVDTTSADVVFVGDRRGDPNTHRLELALLDGLSRRRGEITLSLDVLDRNAQEPLEHFLMGHLDEAEFLKQAAPGPNYTTDYKPLLDLAIEKKWAVVAPSVPNALADSVARSGLDVLKLPDANQALFARDVACPTNDDSFKRFRDALAPQPGKMELARLYAAQCLKDETTAESIAGRYAAAARGGKRPLVVSINGASQSDFGQGIVAPTRRRLPGKRVVTVSILPLQTLDDIAPDRAERMRADYLIYTVGKK